MAATARLDPADVRRTLREAGLRPRHGLSQNFLVDRRRPRGDPRRGGTRPGGAVLEIGPGLGILTGGLLEAGAAVTAIELDRGLAERLRDRLAAPIARADEDPAAPGALRLIEGDALDQPLTRLVPPPYDVVANLPYHITSPILHRLLGEPPRPERLVLMVQREVAERIAAPPGKMSYLSVFVQYHAAVRIALRVPPTAFEPAPDGRIGGHRRRAVPGRRPPRPRRRRTRSGGSSRPPSASGARCSTTSWPGSSRCPPSRSRPRSPPRASPPTGGRRPSRSGSGCACSRRSSGPGRSGRTGAADGAGPVTGPAADPTRRLSPVVRLAPAKLNLTLAVVGRRPDGFHELHSVMVPLGLADRLSLARGRRGPVDTLHVERVRRRAPARDDLVLRAIGGGPRGGRGGLGRVRSAAGAGGPARQADPRRRRAGRRDERRRGRARRGARGLGRDAVDPRAAARSPSGSARTCRSSWPAARRSSRAAASA